MICNENRWQPPGCLLCNSSADRMFISRCFWETFKIFVTWTILQTVYFNLKKEEFSSIYEYVSLNKLLVSNI